MIPLIQYVNFETPWDKAILPGKGPIKFVSIFSIWSAFVSHMVLFNAFFQGHTLALKTLALLKMGTMIPPQMEKNLACLSICIRYGQNTSGSGLKSILDFVRVLENQRLYMKYV